MSTACRPAGPASWPSSGNAIGRLREFGFRLGHPPSWRELQVIHGEAHSDTAAQPDLAAARRMAGLARQVGRACGREPWRAFVRWASRGRLGRRTSWPVVPRLPTPWQDTVSAERSGWRQRAANLDGEFAFAVDYQVCPRCRLGWVEQPYTLPRYQRGGLAAAGLAALRAEYPGLAWHARRALPRLAGVLDRRRRRRPWRLPSSETSASTSAPEAESLTNVPGPAPRYAGRHRCRPQDVTGSKAGCRPSGHRRPWAADPPDHG
jgi:hypothetical protein